MKNLHIGEVEDQNFEENYIRLREKEGRLMDDSVVVELPEFDGDIDLRKEWRMRAHSFNMFSDYLKSRPAENLLEVGCGNGWFLNGLEPHCSSAVGIDINRIELEQGARLFANCEFWYHNLFAGNPSNRRYDLVVFCASLQYFDDLGALWTALKDWLTEDGVIHILDTPFYLQDDVELAADRSKSYYEELHASEMMTYYNHHHWSGLPPHKVHYKPSRWKRKKSPFPWISIKREVL